MAPHSSTLAWKIPWMEDSGGLQSMGSLRVRHNWATSLSLFTFMHWRRKWQPTPVFLPGKSQGCGKPGGLLSMGSHRVGHDWSNLAAAVAAAVSRTDVNFFLLRKVRHGEVHYCAHDHTDGRQLDSVCFNPKLLSLLGRESLGAECGLCFQQAELWRGGEREEKGSFHAGGGFVSLFTFMMG